MSSRARLAWPLYLAWLLCLACLGCSHSVVILELRDAGDDQPSDAAADAGADAEPVPPAGSVSAVAACGFTCAVDDAGVWCWGTDDDGDLPLASDQSAAQPRRADGAYVQLCSAEVHACGLRKDGEIECWGGNAQGQLGLGDSEPRAAPTPLGLGVSFVAVACGGRASCAIADTGKLYCWGDNSEGVPAQADPYGSPHVLTPSLAALDVAVRQVSVGQGHACAVAINGALYCWGRNTDSQLGLGSTPIQQRKPAPSDGSARYNQVAAGQQHTCGIRNDGAVYCWGRELAGRLGQGAQQDGKVVVPGQVGKDSDFVAVSVHWFHSCARRLNGRLLCWGRNQEGQLGVGDEALRDVPTPVSGPSAWTSFTVGRFHTCGITQSQLYCWGMNDTGALGLPSDERQNTPARVPLEEP
ncbi:MAG TPA: hypothetical protein VFZ61_03010 [Polyangiales bacterium]